MQKNIQKRLIFLLFTAAFVLTIIGASSAATVTSEIDFSVSQSTVHVGDSVTLTAHLEANPPGPNNNFNVAGETVNFYNGASLIGSGVTDSNGDATYTYTPSTTGTKNLQARYSGRSDPNPMVDPPYGYSSINSNIEFLDVVSAPNLSVTKSDNPDPVVAGNTLTYTMTVTNNGASRAYNVNIADFVPSALTNVQYSLNNANWNTYTSGTLISLGNINAGSTRNFFIRGTVNPATPAGTITNTAIVYTCNTQRAQDTETTTVVRPVSITKSGATPVTAGTNVNGLYTITVTNNGASNINNVVVTDTFPFTINSGTWSAPGGYSGTITGNTLNANIGTINAGQSRTITINGIVSPTASGTYQNTASLSCSAGSATSNSFQTTVNTQADLAITKTDGQSTVTAGNPTTYTITVTNSGPSSAQNVIIQDTFPASISGISWTAVYAGGASGPASGTGNLNLNLGTLPAGGSCTITVTGTIVPTTPAGSLSNTATVTSTTTDPNPGNNQATDTNTVNRLANLVVTKADSPDPVIAGQTLTYTVTVRNDGPSNIVSTDTLTLTDILPTGFIPSGSWSPSEGSFNAGSWTGVTLAQGESATLIITGTVDPAFTATQLVNTATVVSNVPETSLADNTATTTTTVNRQADLSVTKTDGQTQVTAGTSTTYTITVTNNGPSTITEFGLTGNLPTGLLNPIIGTPSAGSFNPSNGAWTGLNLATGQSVSITLTGLIDPNFTGSSISNTVTVSPPAGVTDPNMANNQATDTNTVTNVSPLTVNKSGPATVVAGNTINYTMSVYNNGPSVAHDVYFADTIPTGIMTPEYSWDNLSWSSYSSGTLINIGDINPLTTVTFYLRGIVDPSTTVTSLQNILNVYKGQTLEGSDSADTTVSRQADLAVTKTGNPDPVKAGQTLTYVIRVTNNGPSDIISSDILTLTDTLPAGFTATSWTASEGTYNAGTWTGLNIDSGQSETLTITGTVDSGISESLTNTVTVTPPEGVTDPNMENNEASATTAVSREADLVLTKTVDNAKPMVKDTIHYTMIVNNHGPDTAVNVQVADKLPAGLRFVSYTANYGTYDPATGIWTIGDLPNGASAVITITSVVENSGNIINEAKVTSLTYDPNLEGNTATAAINAQQPAEVNAATQNTVGMQETGIPVGMLVLAILAVLGGIIAPKRK